MRNLVLFGAILFSSLSNAQNFVHRDGNQIKVGDSIIHLRGMSFGNLVWDDRYSPSLHHQEIDFERVSDLGMNAIRFYMNYKTFESDASPYIYKQSGWDWLDLNIEWAKKHGIYLMLNMHVPQGGFQSQCNGGNLWKVEENQNRVSALWKAIAQKYKDEPQIAGFDIINEPIPTDSIQQWHKLSQMIVDSIRSVDQNHMIITERAIALNCDFGYNDKNQNYPPLNEENIMYTVHLYEPYTYTHQLQSWAKTGEGGKYPDENIIQAPSDIAWTTGDFNNPTLASGTNDWKYFQGTALKITSSEWILGRLNFLGRKLNAGKAFYDDIEVVEFNEKGDKVRTIFMDSLSKEAITKYWWSEDNTGKMSAELGRTDNYSIGVTGNLAGISVGLPDFSFELKNGYSYQVNGWMKGENIPVGATANISMEVYRSLSGKKVLKRNKEALKEIILSTTEYLRTNNYPVYFGEFGVVRVAFDNDKGGERWVSDVISIFDSLGYNFTYHAYKESSFGYFDGWNQPINPVTENLKLKKVFEDYFKHKTLSLKEIHENQKVHIFPNPVGDVMNLEMDLNQIKNIKIYTEEGIFIQSILLQKRIDTSKFISGTYILQIEFKDGTLNSQKFVKK